VTRALAALTLVLGLAASAAAVAEPFGAHVSIRQLVGTGDFDGDGKPDMLYVVSTAAGAHPKDVTAVDGVFGSPAHGPQKTALAISLGNGRKFLVEDGDFFVTPIWSQSPLPLSIAKRGSKPFNEFKRQEKRIASDVVVLGTEAGIDIALYWNGRSFALFQPNEEP
jgi:hypothetical protein